MIRIVIFLLIYLNPLISFIIFSKLDVQLISLKKIQVFSNIQLFQKVSFLTQLKDILFEHMIYSPI